jgi:putative acetyltransferase
VAVVEERVVGHIAFSPVTIDGEFCDWYGLAPVSVHPSCQSQGIGGKLIVEGLARLRDLGAKGCVLLGEPSYYGRFGFVADEGLILEGVPPEYFMVLPFTAEFAKGIVRYHGSFAICG